MTNAKYKAPLILAAAIIVAVMAYGVLTARNGHSAFERISDILHGSPRGSTDQAEQQMDDSTDPQSADATRAPSSTTKDGANP